MTPVETMRIDKTAFDVVQLGADSYETTYWQSKTPAERLAALEFMRQAMYGYDQTTTRLQRVLTTAEHP